MKITHARRETEVLVPYEQLKHGQLQALLLAWLPHTYRPIAIRPENRCSVLHLRGNGHEHWLLGLTAHAHYVYKVCRTLRLLNTI